MFFCKISKKFFSRDYSEVFQILFKAFAIDQYNPVYLVCGIRSAGQVLELARNTGFPKMLAFLG